MYITTDLIFSYMDIRYVIYIASLANGELTPLYLYGVKNNPLP